MVPNNETLGQRIRRLREERGLTQEQLGELIGLRTQGVNQLEKGAITRVGGYLKDLASALEVTENYLLKGDSPEEVERRKIADFARPELRVPSLVAEFEEFVNSRNFRNRDLSQHDLSELMRQFRKIHEFQEDMHQFGSGPDNG